MPDRTAVAEDVARTVHELNVLARRLGVYHRNLPHLVTAEQTDLMHAAFALLAIINAIMEEQLRERVECREA